MHKWINSQSCRRALFIVFLTIGYLILSIIIARYFVASNIMVNGDFFTFWAGGKLISNGGDPYKQADWLTVHRQAGSTWFPNPTFVYPLPVAVMFSPLAAFSINTAATVWLVISQSLILGAILLTISALRWKRAVTYAPFIFLGVAFFRPTLITMTNGQLSNLLLFAIAAAANFWSRNRWFWGGALIALLALKPTSAILFLPAVGLWFLLRREWHGITGMGVSFIFLWIVGAIVKYDWLTDFLSIGPSKVTLTWSTTIPPTIWGWILIMTHHDPDWMLVAGGISLGLLVTGLWLTLHVDRGKQWLAVTGLIMPLAIASAPYLWNYDQVMLVAPVVATMAMLDQARSRFSLIALLPFGIDFIAVGLFLLAVRLGHDGWGWLLPISVTLMFGAVFWFTLLRPDKTVTSGADI